jgi:hypothetical protein
MEIKSLDEIKHILSTNPEFNGVGYVVTPQLLKIAHHVGLVGYDEALLLWNTTGVMNERVYQKGEDRPKDFGLQVNWDGPSLLRCNGGILVGLKKTLENIEAAITIPEIKE